jgi:hypothetical protein
MNKAELHAFAAAGVAQKVAAIEQELGIYHREWPELFLSPTAPQLLKAPLRTYGTGNGHWPIVATKPHEAPAADALTIDTLLAERHERHRNAVKASWTPARRAKQARLMKARRKGSAILKGHRAGKRIGGRVVDGVHAYLQAHGESSLKELMQATKTGASNVVSTMQSGLKSGRFVRVRKGRYTLGPQA